MFEYIILLLAYSCTYIYFYLIDLHPNICYILTLILLFRILMQFVRLVKRICSFKWFLRPIAILILVLGLVTVYVGTTMTVVHDYNIRWEDPFVRRLNEICAQGEEMD